jgi:hypothetical protein
MLGRIAVTVVLAVAIGTVASLDVGGERLRAVERPGRGARAATPGPSATPAPPRTIGYEVRGFDNRSDLEQFARDVAATYVDPRGWGLGGAVRLARVPAGGSFTIWLAASARVPRFGGPCDAFYSCMQDRNVVINEDRWLSGTPAWNGSGASLADYRHMVVNHETGHWLGFTHAECRGAGATAAVMQQQSISMRGCTPSAWPSPDERRWAAVALGVDGRFGVPFGALDAVSGGARAVRVRGWALDPDSTGPTLVTVRVDGTASGHAASRLRPDVALTHPGKGPAHGFALVLPATPGPHRVCVDAMNVAGAGHSVALGCTTVRAGANRRGSRPPR